MAPNFFDLGISGLCIGGAKKLFPSISERVETSPASLIALWFNNY